jgi:hypothetical protein
MGAKLPEEGMHVISYTSARSWALQYTCTSAAMHRLHRINQHGRCDITEQILLSLSLPRLYRVKLRSGAPQPPQTPLSAQAVCAVVRLHPQCGSGSWRLVHSPRLRTLPLLTNKGSVLVNHPTTGRRLLSLPDHALLAIAGARRAAEPNVRTAGHVKRQRQHLSAATACSRRLVASPFGLLGGCRRRLSLQDEAVAAAMHSVARRSTNWLMEVLANHGLGG